MNEVLKENISENNNNMFQNIKNILKLMKQRKFFIFLSFMEIFRGFFMVQGQAWGLKWIGDGCINKNTNLFLWGALAFSCATIFSTILVICIDYNCLKIVAKTKSDIRQQMMKSLLKSEVQKTDKYNMGEFTNYFNSNVTQLGELYRTIYFFIGSFGKVTSSLVVGFTLSWQLTIIVILTGLLIILINKHLVKNLENIVGNIINNESELIKEVSQCIKGSIFYRILGNERKLNSYFMDVNEKINKESMKEANISANIYSVFKLFDFFIVIIVLALGSYLISRNKLTIGSLTAFFTILDSLMNPYRFIADFLKKYSQLHVSYKYIDDIIKLDTNNYEKINENLESLKHNKFYLKMDNVYFGYDENLTLKKLNLTAESGKITYIIGKSGIGKTTIFKLLMGFYKPNKGSMYLHQDNIEKIDIDRGMFTYISQNPFLFNGTIRENITLDSDNINEEKLKDAIRKAGISEFILNLPDKFDTRIRDGGKDLSGGQKCRISLARAFYRSTPIYLFDEVYSSLDNNTISDIDKSLKELSKSNKCILVISHRHEWIKETDNIIEI